MSDLNIEVDEVVLAKRNKVIKMFVAAKRLEMRALLMKQELQSVCKHERVIECVEMSSSPVFCARPHKRVCGICNLEEDGPNYVMLKVAPLRSVDRDELSKYRCRSLSSPIPNVAKAVA